MSRWDSLLKKMGHKHSGMVYDASIRKWRKRTQADIEYGKKLLAEFKKVGK